MATDDRIPVAFQGVLKESAGYKLLFAMGWREGNGLGVNGSGLKRAIRLKRVAAGQGIGVDKMRDEDRKTWEKSTDSYEALLKNLKEITSHGLPENSTGKTPVQELPGISKKNRKKKSVMRYSKQKKSKLVRSYSEADLAAILGTKDEVETSQTKKSRTALIPIQSTPELTDPSEEKWWSKMFVCAGRLGSLHIQNPTEPGDVAPSRLDEDNQEQLYTAAAKRSSKSKQGLGKKRTKIGGAEINKGKRRVFEDGDEAEPKIHSSSDFPVDRRRNDDRSRSKKAKKRQKTV